MAELDAIFKSIEKVGPKWNRGLRCKNCGCSWRPNVGPHGHLARYWHRCPNGCNADVAPQYRPMWDPSGDFGRD
jgi:hypothetical protein